MEQKQEAPLTPEDVLDMYLHVFSSEDYLKKKYPEIYKAVILAMKKYAAEEVLEYAKADPSEALKEIIEICSNGESSIELIAKVEKIAEQALSSTATSEALPKECQSKEDGVCRLPIGSCEQCSTL